VERRDPDRPKAYEIRCRLCGEAVPLVAERMRLTLTHAMAPCPSCDVMIRVRRSDAFGDADAAIAWQFSSYADDAPASTARTPHGG
jgi:hypothetical protein